MSLQSIHAIGLASTLLETGMSVGFAMDGINAIYESATSNPKGFADLFDVSEESFLASFAASKVEFLYGFAALLKQKSFSERADVLVRLKIYNISSLAVLERI